MPKLHRSSHQSTEPPAGRLSPDFGRKAHFWEHVPSNPCVTRASQSKHLAWEIPPVLPKYFRWHLLHQHGISPLRFGSQVRWVSACGAAAVLLASRRGRRGEGGCWPGAELPRVWNSWSHGCWLKSGCELAATLAWKGKPGQKSVALEYLSGW